MPRGIGTYSPQVAVSTLTSQSVIIESTLAAGTITVTDVPRFIAAGISSFSNVVGAKGTYTITLTSAIDLVNGDTVQVKFPPEISLPTKLSCSVGINVKKISCISVDSKTIRFTVSTWASNPLAANSTLSFTLDNVQNPTSTQPSSTFTISTTISSTTSLNNYRVT
jgi:hypothetical protein